ncbi:MAG: hypothetical protein RLZZ367_1972 [Bacteroidota bacterium]|jgi:hypothetical protein
MKIHLLTSILLVSGIANTFATHCGAADITFRVIGNYKIEANVTVYSKIEGISALADNDSVEINWGDGVSGWAIRTNGTDNNANGYPDGELIDSIFKKSIYSCRHTFPGSPPPPVNFYLISFRDLTRMDGIININNGNSAEVPFFIEDTIFSWALSGRYNSSPAFLTPGVCYANLNDTLNFNLLAYDADGDSLSFELIPSLQSNGTQPPLYTRPDEYCQASGFPLNAFQLNPETGQVLWTTPCRVGLYSVLLLVKEYRCGVLLSTVMNDWQVIVLNTPNDPPAVSTISDITINTGDSIGFTVSATDINSTQSVSLQLQGGAFLAAQNAPMFQSTQGNPAMGTFTWQTGLQSANHNPYIFSVIARDNYEQPGNPSTPIPLSSYQTFRIWVTDNSPCNFSYTGIDDLELSSGITIYPNPANNQLHVNTNGITVKQIAIYNTTGQLVAMQNLPANSTIDISQLNSGVYFVKAELAGNNTITQRFVKM